MKIKQTYLLAIILVLATLYFYQDPQSNGNARLDTTRAIVEHGSFQIDAYLNQPGGDSIDKAFFNGHYYTDKAIGTSLFAVPPYWLLYNLATALHILLAIDFIKHFLTFLIIGASFVINGIILYKIALLISPNSWKAFIATLAVSLGTMLWPYSVVYYGHVPAAMFLTIAFYMLFSARTSGEISHAKFFGAGLALGFAFITDYTTALIIACLIIYAVFILGKQKPVFILQHGLAGAFGALIPLSMMFAYNFSVYGNIFTISYTNEASIVFNQGPNFGLVGYIALPNLSALYHISFDPKFGLFWESPVLILAIIGYFVALKARSFRAEAIVSLFSILSIFLMTTGVTMWWGGSAFGPRYLIVALPFFIIPLMLIPDVWIWILGGLTVVSAAQMMIPLIGKIQVGLDFDATKDQFSINGPFTGFSILYNYGLPIIIKLRKKGTLPWSLGHALGISYYKSPILLMVAEAVFVGLFYIVYKKAGQSLNKDT